MLKLHYYYLGQIENIPDSEGLLHPHSVTNL